MPFSFAGTVPVLRAPGCYRKSCRRGARSCRSRRHFDLVVVQQALTELGVGRIANTPKKSCTATRANRLRWRDQRRVEPVIMASLHSGPLDAEAEDSGVHFARVAAAAASWRVTTSPDCATSEYLLILIERTTLTDSTCRGWRDRRFLPSAIRSALRLDPDTSGCPPTAITRSCR